MLIYYNVQNSRCADRDGVDAQAVASVEGHLMKNQQNAEVKW